MTERGLRNSDLEAALAEAFRLHEEELDAEETELPSEDVLAVMTGTATSAETSRVLRILAQRDDLRESMVQATEHSLPGVKPRRPGGTWMIAAAACVLLGFLAWLVGVDTGNGVVSRTVATLQRADFESADRLWSIASANGEEWSLRGGLVRSLEARVVAFDLVEPLGLALSRRPQFRWTAPPDCGPWRLRLMTYDGNVLLDVRSDRPQVVWPDQTSPLLRGESYRVVLDDVSRHYPVRASVFTVLPAVEAEALTAELDGIERTVEQPVARHFLRARALAHRGIHGLAGRELVQLVRLLGSRSTPALERFLIANAAPELARRIRFEH